MGFFCFGLLFGLKMKKEISGRWGCERFWGSYVLGVGRGMGREIKKERGDGAVGMEQ